VADILIIHDQGKFTQPLVDYLRDEGQTVVEAADLNQARAVSRSTGADYDVVLLSSPKDKTAPSPVGHAKREWPMADVIVIGGPSDLADAVDAIRNGASDFVPAGDLARLATTVRGADRKPRPRDAGAAFSKPVSQDAVAVDPAMQAILQKADRAAAVNSPVLITGESGTGKEVIAQRIHRNSRRRHSKFVPVNCGSIPETLIETELFGYRKGAFTGAISNTKGLIEEAESGVLFLDEIGDMPFSMQVRLLRFLDSGEVRAVGSSSVHHVDVRVVAATNRSLDAEIEQRRFREDLFFRLSVIQIHLPPLRKRRADIPALAQHLVRRAAHKLGLRPPGFTREALSMLVAYHWPGNIRQLQNVLEQALVQVTGDTVTPFDLPPEIVHPGDVSVASRAHHVEHERDRLATTLRRHNGNHTQAAAELGISRTTLWRRLRDQKTAPEVADVPDVQDAVSGPAA
jgi:two-component system, NtrC family, response regulator AtoC